MYLCVVCIPYGVHWFLSAIRNCFAPLLKKATDGQYGGAIYCIKHFPFQLKTFSMFNSKMAFEDRNTTFRRTNILSNLNICIRFQFSEMMSVCSLHWLKRWNTKKLLIELTFLSLIKWLNAWQNKRIEDNLKATSLRLPHKYSKEKIFDCTLYT